MNGERAGRCLRQVEHIHGNMLASFKHYNPNQELPFYPMYSLINCLESSFQIAGMVKTQWISSSLKLSPAFLVLRKKWSLRYRIDSEKTVSADIDLPLSSNNFILLLIFLDPC